jgi:hypothetical protein
MMPKSALPDNYVIGPDNQSWLMRLKKKVQIWLAAGPRASGFWKWREIPKHLIAIKGQGKWRYENTDGTEFYGLADTFIFKDSYISRIQPWCRWHVSLQWPLYFNCHWIYCQKNVVAFPTYQSEFGITKMLTFGIGFKRDADKVYWLSANAGGNFE